MAEGASAVNSSNAADAAAEAKDAAALALSVAQSNIETSATITESKDAAEGAAAQASVSAQMVHEALSAQTAAIAALAEQLKERKQAPSGGKPFQKASSDNSPGEPARGAWFYKKRGGKS